MADHDPTQPRHDEQWLGEFKVVQIDRREDGKVTQCRVIDANGKQQLATKHGQPLPLSAVPQVKLKNADGVKTCGEGQQ